MGAKHFYLCQIITVTRRAAALARLFHSNCIVIKLWTPLAHLYLGSRPNAPARWGYLRKTLLKGRIQRRQKTRWCFLLLHSFANVDAVGYVMYINILIAWLVGVRLIQESGAKWAYTVRLAKFLDVCARASMISFSARTANCYVHACLARVIGVIKRANLLAADAILHSKYGRVFSRGRR